jgi:hypothetical protein
MQSVKYSEEAKQIRQATSVQGRSISQSLNKKLLQSKNLLQNRRMNEPQLKQFYKLQNPQISNTKAVVSSKFTAQEKKTMKQMKKKQYVNAVPPLQLEQEMKL